MLCKVLPQQLPQPSEEVRKGRRELLDALQASDPHNGGQRDAVSPLSSVGFRRQHRPIEGALSRRGVGRILRLYSAHVRRMPVAAT